MASLVVASGGRLTVPARGIVGVEVEIAGRIKRDITPEIAAGGPESVLAAFDVLIGGIEIIGTRFNDRRNAGTFGPLADNSATGGYVFSDEEWTGGTVIETLSVEIEVDGKQIYSAPAKHPFGGVFNPVIAYGKAQNDRFGALKAGMIVTTGSLCGVVPVATPCRVTARIAGSYTIEVELA
jgi:2-keto-4-pentenoate hydratase